MTEVLNEVARGEPDQFAPSSDISLRVVSQKSVPSPEQLADRNRAYELQGQQCLTAVFFGDPLPGRSALDRRRAEQSELLSDALQFSCLVFFVTGIVIAAAILL